MTSKTIQKVIKYENDRNNQKNKQRTEKEEGEEDSINQ